MSKELAAQLLARCLEDSKGCLVFQGALSVGYPSVRRFGKTLQGHLVVYEAAYGRKPNGLVILHTCNNRACLNEKHLKADTQKENLLQARRDGALPFSGLSGVTFEKKRHRWIARRPTGPRTYTMLYQGPDFLEACCARKSWEASQ